MSKFKGFTLYIPSMNTEKEGVRIRLPLHILAMLFLILLPLMVLTISSMAGIWTSVVLEYRCGIESVKRTVHIRALKRLRNRADSFENAIAKLIESDRVCRISYGMKPIDSGKLQAGIGGTALKSSEALEQHKHHDIVTAYRLAEQFDFYSRQTRLIQSSIDRLEKRMDSEQERLRATPSIIPANGKFSSGFGYRYHPVLGRTAMHEGFDFTGREWTPVLASADGIVVKAEYDNGGYGNLIEIRHPASGYRTRYAHLVDFNVSAGDVVKRGEQIGSMGNTGRSTGTHLHYEVLSNGNPINPERFLIGRFVEKKHDS